MKKYIYAISIVASKNGNLNNQISNGIGTIEAIVGWITKISYDERFVSNINLINCNIQELGNSDNTYEFNRQYPRGNLDECLDYLVLDIQSDVS